MIGVLMPALMAGMWPLNSALVILWFLSALVAVASATLSLLSAALLLATREAGRGLQLSFAGTLCFWAHIVGRESTLSQCELTAPAYSICIFSLLLWLARQRQLGCFGPEGGSQRLVLKERGRSRPIMSETGPSDYILHVNEMALKRPSLPSSFSVAELLPYRKNQLPACDQVGRYECELQLLHCRIAPPELSNAVRDQC
jgi:hypothetical protein